MTPEERVRADLKMTGGRMPIRVVVVDLAEKARGEQAKAGHPHGSSPWAEGSRARLVTIMTEDEAGR